MKSDKASVLGDQNPDLRLDYTLLQDQLRAVYHVLAEVKECLGDLGQKTKPISAGSRRSLASRDRTNRISNFADDEDLICYEKIDLSKIKKLQSKVIETLQKISFSQKDKP